MRKTYPAELKAAVVLEALKEQLTMEEISSKYEVPVHQIHRWKKQAKENMAKLFQRGKKKEEKEKDALIEKLYKELGKATVERDWLKKKLGVIE